MVIFFKLVMLLSCQFIVIMAPSSTAWTTGLKDFGIYFKMNHNPWKKLKERNF
jgi:hypothetical protein